MTRGREASVIRLEVISPARTVVDTDVEMVVLPAEDGLIGFLPGHAPTVVAMAPGVLSYTRGHETLRLAVGGGFCEVTPARVLVLADSAERSDEIDVERARAAFEQARARLDRELSDRDHERAEAALKRATARLQVAGAWRRKFAYTGRAGRRRAPTAEERDET